MTTTSRDNNDCFGLQVANQITDYLVSQMGIAEQHRDYCGTGFWYEHETFWFAHVYDGWPIISEKDNGSNYGYIEKFSNRSTFVAWLSQQSDHSLSQHGGVQCLSYDKLIKYIE